MRLTTVLLAGTLALVAGSATAAINPADPGLPASWTFLTEARGYGTPDVVKNGASSMCVECHSVNPSPHIVVPSDQKTLGIDNTSRFWGSHTVMNALQNAAIVTYTNSGGGFVGGFGNAPRDGGEYFNNATSTRWESGAESKFAVGDTFTSVAQGETGYAVGTANLICESCHNIVTNLGANLLLDVYEDNGDDALCLKCHSTSALSIEGFHGNDNLPAFFGTTARKRHHVLTGDVFDPALYGTTGNSSVMWAPIFSTPLAEAWCTDRTAKPGSADLANVTDDTVTFRNKCNVGGQGAKATGALTGDILAVDADTITCGNCHRPHNAMSGGGAFILRAGKAVADGFDFPGKSSATSATSGIGYGIRRQADVGAYTNKVYGEYVGLCQGCHVGYGE